MVEAAGVEPDRGMSTRSICSAASCSWMSCCGRSQDQPISWHHSRDSGRDALLMTKALVSAFRSCVAMEPTPPAPPMMSTRSTPTGRSPYNCQCSRPEIGNLVVDDKIVIKCHHPQRTILANLDVLQFPFELVLRRSEDFHKFIEMAQANPIELSVIFAGAINLFLVVDFMKEHIGVQHELR
jgi:hypothetical protein